MCHLNFKETKEFLDQVVNNCFYFVIACCIVWKLILIDQFVTSIYISSTALVSAVRICVFFGWLVSVWYGE
jgi:hypothetical protein